MPLWVLLARSNMRWMLVPVMLSLGCQSGKSRDKGEALAFDVSPGRVQIGYDAPFSIAVRMGDAEPQRIEIRWTQIAGPPLRDVALTEHGMRFSARTPRLADCRNGSTPWGIIPLSPRTRGEFVLEAEWRPAGARDSRRERIVVAAAARSRGLPNVPVDQRLYLGGTGWRVKEAPPQGRAMIEQNDGLAALRPDVRGIWTLEDVEGRAMRIQAGRYVETPLDCGRAGCHAEIARAAQSSAMTWALSRRLHGRALRGDASVADAERVDDVACALECHTTGERGLHDGGFFDVASDLKMSPSLDGIGEAADLPRALRRLGSVGCLACHGPSALPEADARWSILRSDVCGHCHDAPPRYGHVVAWQTTSMSRADQDPRARSDRACTPCHTTWGFLDTIGGPANRDEVAHTRAAPAGVGAIGITCPACHGVHEPSAEIEVRHHLLRTPRLSKMFEEVPAGARDKSATCIVCHAPRQVDATFQRKERGAPTDRTMLSQASSAALWAGRGGIDPETGTPLTGPSPHLAIDGGCVGCHSSGPDGVERGLSHGFRADRRRCATCHEAAREALWAQERARMETEARDLWSDLLRRGTLVPASSTSAPSTAAPPHAAVAVAANATPPLGRTAYDLSLLLEDRGFFAHNLPYARVLLDKARHTIERVPRDSHRHIEGADR